MDYYVCVSESYLNSTLPERAGRVESLEEAKELALTWMSQLEMNFATITIYDQFGERYYHPVVADFIWYDGRWMKEVEWAELKASKSRAERGGN